MGDQVTVAGRHPSCIEEKQAHEKAKRRLQFCQDQLQKVKKWAAKIRHEADEFRGRMASLGRCLDGDFPKTVATLESMARTLESYAEIRPPGEELLADNAPPTSTEPTPPE